MLINPSTFALAKSGMIFFLQNGPMVEMADQLRTNGKIYVVVVVLLIVLLGILAYLISLDRKISKLEQSKK